MKKVSKLPPVLTTPPPGSGPGARTVPPVDLSKRSSGRKASSDSTPSVSSGEPGERRKGKGKGPKVAPVPAGRPISAALTTTVRAIDPGHPPVLVRIPPTFGRRIRRRFGPKVRID